MAIERVELHLLSLPLVSPFEAGGQRIGVRDTLLVSLHEEGIAGWGEVVAFSYPWYTPETLAGAMLVLEHHLIPAIIGREIPDVETFLNLTVWVKGNQMARAGMELAWWDLHGRRMGRSLSDMLGGVRSRVEVGVSIGLQVEPKALIRSVAAYLKQGYRRVKIKVARDWLAEPVRLLRREFGAEIRLQIDANSAFTLEDTALFQQIDDAGLLLIEQPLGDDDLVEHAALQSVLRTPLCLDESIDGPGAARAALALGACRVINLKQGRVGGLSVARAIHDLCQRQGSAVWCGGMLETGIGRAANLALASLPGFTLPGDISATDRYFEHDITEERFQLIPQDSTIAVPRGPGLGVTIDRKALLKATITSRSFSSNNFPE